MDSGWPKKPCIRWGIRLPRVKGNFDGEKGVAQDMPGHVRRLICSKRFSRGTAPVGMDADWGILDGIHIGATWRIRLNRQCVMAMRPYVKLL